MLYQEEGNKVQPPPYQGTNMENTLSREQTWIIYMRLARAGNKGFGINAEVLTLIGANKKPRLNYQPGLLKYACRI